MTSLQLQMILHYHTRPTPYAQHEPEHANSALVRDQRVDLENKDLLEYNATDQTWHTTERGKAYVEFLCAMPLPVTKWVMP